MECGAKVIEFKCREIIKWHATALLDPLVIEFEILRYLSYEIFQNKK